MDDKRIRKIKAFVMDVDGTLTDGSIYIGDAGEIMKRFHVRDGYAIKHILPAYHILPMIITGRESEIVRKRCAELGIAHMIQGSQDKKTGMLKLLNREKISLEETAFIGDDLNDMECIKIAGLSACPADAVEQIKKEADYVAEKHGGFGAVREFIDWMIVKF